MTSLSPNATATQQLSDINADSASQSTCCNGKDSRQRGPAHGQSNPLTSSSCSKSVGQFSESTVRTYHSKTTVAHGNHHPSNKKTMRSSSVCHGNTLSTQTESYGGLEYSFIEEVPDDLVCSVCTKVILRQCVCVCVYAFQYVYINVCVCTSLGICECVCVTRVNY